MQLCPGCLCAHLAVSSRDRSARSSRAAPAATTSKRSRRGARDRSARSSRAAPAATTSKRSRRGARGRSVKYLAAPDPAVTAATTCRRSRGALDRKRTAAAARPHALGRPARDCTLQIPDARDPNATVSPKCSCQGALGPGVMTTMAPPSRRTQGALGPPVDSCCCQPKAPKGALDRTRSGSWSRCRPTSPADRAGWAADPPRSPAAACGAGTRERDGQWCGVKLAGEGGSFEVNRYTGVFDTAMSSKFALGLQEPESVSSTKVAETVTL